MLCLHNTWPHIQTHAHPAHLSLRCTGIMATAAPRADLVGTARFVDPTHRLCCEVHFGRIEGATHPLLERSDSFAAELFSYTSPTESPGEKVRPGSLLCHLGALQLQASIAVSCMLLCPCLKVEKTRHAPGRRGR